MHDKNDVWFRPAIKPQEPVSPCNNLCVISSQTGFCIGCFRTLKEIGDWESGDFDDKEVILEKVKERRREKESEVSSDE